MKATKTIPSTNRSSAWRTAARFGAVTAATLLAVSSQAQVPVFTNVWSVTAGTYADLPANEASNVRGVAISPLTTNVLYSSTTGGTNGGTVNHVAVLDFANGSNYLAQLNGTGVSGGTVTLMNVRVSDDGSVYACNRRDGGINTFTIYRWPSELDTATAPVKVVDQPFTWRMGDHMDVRGSGMETEIVVVGGSASGATASTNFVIFRPTDAALTSFTNFSITIPGYTASSIVSAHGVTFEGTNNAIYVQDGSKVRRVSYDPTALTATVTRTNATDSANCRALKYYKATNGVEILASVQYNSTAGAAQIARVFQIPSNPTAALVSVLRSNFPAPYTGSRNGNGLGQVDGKHGFFAFSAPGYGLSFFQVVDYVFNVPPSGGAIAGGGAYVEGYPVTLTASANGTAPLSYQWFFNTNTLIAGVTSDSYSLGPVQPAQAGYYNVVVSNAFGVVTGSFAGLTVLPGKYSNFATNLWTLAPGSRPYLTTGDTQRGLAYDAVSNVVVVVSRSPSNLVALLSADTGAEIGTLDVSALYPPYPTPPGTLPINMAGVADDGAVYVANLLLGATTDSFAIYRWQNADPLAFPSQSYLGNPAVGRLGDTMSVRGAGISTEILCAFRTGTNVALFTTGDGYSFSPTIVAVTNLPADAVSAGFAGLGLAFGKDNTFWAKSSNFRLRRVAYDATTGLGEVIETYDSLPMSDAPLGVDNVNGYVATVGFGQTPQNLAIWDVSQGPPNAVQLDRELFGANNANANGTGAVAVDVAGGRFFALDSNNGLIALAYGPRLGIAATPQGSVVTWTGPGTLQATTNLLTGWQNLPTATSPYTNAATTQIFFRVKR
jgi:hypothetical protein